MGRSERGTERGWGRLGMAVGLRTLVLHPRRRVGWSAGGRCSGEPGREPRASRATRGIARWAERVVLERRCPGSAPCQGLASHPLAGVMGGREVLSGHGAAVEQRCRCWWC